MDASDPGAPVLHVDARFRATPSDSLSIDDDAAPFVRDARFEGAHGWLLLPSAGPGWMAPCHGEGCHVRYEFALGQAADHLRDLDAALRAGGIVVAPPSTWLMRPSSAGDGEGRLRVHIQGEPGLSVATGIAPPPVTQGRTDERKRVDSADRAGDREASFEADIDELEAASFVAFGSFAPRAIAGPGFRVDVAVARTGLTLNGDEALAWVARGVEALRAYYGGFPVRHVLVIVLPGTAAETQGETIGDAGPTVVIRAARGLNAAAARADWVVTHELIHATLPSFGRNHAWLDEGIATYVEPIARARVGLVDTERFWRELAEGLPQGLPGPGDEGLERTHTWGRMYWGGALFCFVADVRVREATRNARSFDDALRAVASDRGGDTEARRGGEKIGVDRFLALADGATGTTVFSALYRELALAPGGVDLTGLWSRLGVHVAPATPRSANAPPNAAGPPARVTFDDRAPLAGLRRAITAPVPHRPD